MLSPQLLTAKSFAGYGFVVSTESANDSKPANQGKAVKFCRVSEMHNGYENAPSGVVPKVPSMAIFRCEGPQLDALHLCVNMLERHPYTTQTFSPLGARKDALSYMVVVAGGNDRPELDTLQAFVATGDIGVTYAAGQWHAPMIALERQMDFCVIQYENGRDSEDCELFRLEQSYDIIIPKRD